MPTLFTYLQRSSQGIDIFNEWLGRCIAWLTLAMVLIMFSIVLLRYLLNISWVGMQESIIYLHGMVFMLGTAYTLKQDAHVRVDIIYQHLSLKAKAWVDLLGTLFLLLPVAGFILWSSWDYVMDSWAILEGSRHSGGLPFVYVLKSCLLLMAGLLSLQGLALCFAKIVTLFYVEHQHG